MRCQIPSSGALVEDRNIDCGVFGVTRIAEWIDRGRPVAEVEKAAKK